MSASEDRCAALPERSAEPDGARRAAAAEARAHALALLLSRALLGASAFGLLAVSPAAAALGASAGLLRLVFGAFVAAFILSVAMVRLLFLGESALAQVLRNELSLDPRLADFATRAPAPLGFLATVAVATGAGAATAALMETSWPS